MTASASARVIGGGRVIDPFAMTRARRQRERLMRIVALDRPETDKALDELLKVSRLGVDLEAFSLARNLKPEDAEQIFSAVAMHRVTTKTNDTAFTLNRWNSMIRTILEALGSAPGSDLAEPGLNLVALRHAIGTGLSQDTILALIDELLGGDQITFDGQYVRLPGQVRFISPEDAIKTKRVIEALKKDSPSSPDMGPLADQLTVDPAQLSQILRRMESEGTVVPVATNRYFLTEVIYAFAQVVRTANVDSEGIIQLSEFRRDTGLIRNQAIEVLEYFDRVGFTRRIGNGRVVLKPVSAVFPQLS